MKVNGKEIDQAVIHACLARMKSGLHFRAFEIEGVAERQGIPRRDGSAMRLADRMIQRERKSGNIKLITSPQRCWKWIGVEE